MSPTINETRRLSMNRLQLLLITLLMFGFIENSQALMNCSSNGITQGYTDIPNTISVPNEAAAGTILWRSSTTSLSLKCHLDLEDSWQHVMLKLSPDDISNSSLGPHVEMGVNYNGTDYQCSQTPGCWIITNPNLIMHCNTVGTPCPVYNVPITYSLFLVKKSAPGTNSSGPITPLTNYKAFHIIGERLQMTHPKINYSLTVRNMNLINYILCPATVSFSTQNIDFGTLYRGQAAPNTVASHRKLTLTATRRCDDDTVFSMSTYMKPANFSSISPGEDLLIPHDVNNEPFDSVAFELRRNGIRIPFNRESPMFDASKDTSRSQDLEANLIWRTDKPRIGTFTGGVIMEFFHR